MTLAPLTPSRTRGKTLFITFYSFKGGVGRTMSLVNAACILAARGRRVLLIDFDLEAPGLTTLRDLSSKDGPPQQHPGLVELIHDFLRNPKTSALTDQRDKKRFHAEYICPLEIPPHLERIEGGSLDLMPCGRMDETYGQRLNAIKFDQIYEEGIGQPLFKLLKTVIQQSKLYDYVLIDSRTGFSDEGGICTRDLADHIFVIMGLNRQNVDGTVRFLHSLNRSGWQEGRVFFVVSPMPVFYEELRDTRLAEARQQIEATGYKTDLKLYIPYHPRLSLDEEPFVYHWSETNLFDAYQRIQRQIRQLNNDVPSTWWDETIKAIQTSQFEQALHLLKQIKAEDIDLASNLLSVVTEQMVADTPALLQHISAFFDLRLEITGEDAEVLFRYGLSLIENCNYNYAYEILSRSFAISVEQKNRLQMERVRLALGNLMFSQSRLKEAYSYYELALKSFEELEEKEGIAAAQSLLGSIYLVIGKNKQALDYFEMAQGLYDQLKQHVPLAWGHGSIGTAYTALGRYANATHHYNIALTALKELHARSGIARTQMSIGRINFLRGNIELALSMYMEV